MEKKPESKKETKKKTSALDLWRDIVPFILAICVVFLLISHSERAKEIEALEKRIEQQEDISARLDELEKKADKQDSTIMAVGGWINDLRDLINSLHGLEESGTNTESNDPLGGNTP